MKTFCIAVFSFFSLLSAAQNIGRSADGKSLILKPGNRVYQNAERKEITAEEYSKLANSQQYNMHSTADISTFYLVRRSVEADFTGTRFPFSKFSGVNGENISIGDTGNSCLVSVWNTRCPPCIKELRVLDLMADEFPGLTCIALTEDSTETVTAFMQTHGYQWSRLNIVPCFKTADYPLLDEVNTNPVTFILDKNLMIQKAFIGGKLREIIATLDAVNK